MVAIYIQGCYLFLKFIYNLVYSLDMRWNGNVPISMWGNLRLIECFPIIMVKPVLVKEHVVNGFNLLRTVISRRRSTL